MTQDEIINMAHPDSGCKLARTMTFAMFHGLCLRAGDVCKQCIFNPCQRMKKIEDLKRQKEAKRRVKYDLETNAEIAKRLGITPRQASKMRKRGEI
jgi:hypothetical protein